MPLGKTDDKTLERTKENEDGSEGEGLTSIGRFAGALEDEETDGRHRAEPEELTQRVCSNPTLPELMRQKRAGSVVMRPNARVQRRRTAPSVGSGCWLTAVAAL
jgi:hypothetical protein